MASTIERASKPYEVLHQVSQTEDTDDGFLRFLRARTYLLPIESPEDRDARFSATLWETLQRRADQYLATNQIYRQLYRRYLGLVEDLQQDGMCSLSERKLDEMIGLGEKMREFERIANSLAPILTGGYPRNLHLPPTSLTP